MRSHSPVDHSTHRGRPGRPVPSPRDSWSRRRHRPPGRPRAPHGSRPHAPARRPDAGRSPPLGRSGHAPARGTARGAPVRAPPRSPRAWRGCSPRDRGSAPGGRCGLPARPLRPRSRGAEARRETGRLPAGEPPASDARRRPHPGDPRRQTPRWPPAALRAPGPTALAIRGRRQVGAQSRPPLARSPRRESRQRPRPRLAPLRPGLLPVARTRRAGQGLPTARPSAPSSGQSSRARCSARAASR